MTATIAPAAAGQLVEPDSAPAAAPVDAVPAVAPPGADEAPIIFDSAGQVIPTDGDGQLLLTGVDQTAIALDSAGQVMPTDNAGWLLLTDTVGRVEDRLPASETRVFGCDPDPDVDRPHWSEPDVSGHGWWKGGNCENETANVKNCLFQYYSNNTYWQKACSPTKVLKRGSGGSGRRTVARKACDNRTSTTWRNYVSVDVIGEVDTGGEPFKQSNVDCRVR